MIPPPKNTSRSAALARGSTARFIHSLPKTELHLHLEGSAEPETLRDLARSKRRAGEQIEVWIRERERHSFRYRSFADFLNAFKRVTLLLESPADYALITSRLLERLAEQNVHYAEITLSAGVIIWKKQPLPEIFEAISEAAGHFRNVVRVKWIFDAVRHFGADHAREVLGWARIFRDDGVVALGIGGDEQRGPAGLFADVYREAREVGLHTTAHAGEACGPESVHEAIKTLGAERIGHGLTAARDPRVTALLAARQVPLEVCLSSNVATGLIARLEDHPLRRFVGAGIPVTLNTDDPAMFGTSLNRELELASVAFGLTEDEITALLKNSVAASFNSKEARQSLLAELEEAARLAVRPGKEGAGTRCQ